MGYVYEKGKGYRAKILLDSTGPSGKRITTWELRYPRMVHPDAQPEIAHVARMMRETWTASTPRLLMEGECHLPLVDKHDSEHVESCDGTDVSESRHIAALGHLLIAG